MSRGAEGILLQSNQIPDLLVRRVTDSGNLLDFLERPKPTVLLAVIDDALRKHSADPGQEVEILR